MLTRRISAEPAQGALPALFLVTDADCSSLTCCLHFLGALHVFRHPSGLYFRGIKPDSTRVIELQLLMLVLLWILLSHQVLLAPEKWSGKLITDIRINIPQEVQRTKLLDKCGL